MTPSRLLTLVAALACLACLPIPVNQDGLLRPDLEVTVVAADGGPVRGVEVVLRRAATAPGPTRELSRFSKTTDASGRVRFSREETTDSVMPLMMHGVPELSFHVCAQGSGGSAVTRLKASPADRGATREAVQLQLDPAQPECRW